MKWGERKEGKNVKTKGERGEQKGIGERKKEK